MLSRCVSRRSFDFFLHPVWQVPAGRTVLCPWPTWTSQHFLTTQSPNPVPTENSTVQPASLFSEKKHVQSELRKALSRGQSVKAIQLYEQLSPAERVQWTNDMEAEGVEDVKEKLMVALAREIDRSTRWEQKHQLAALQTPLIQSVLKETSSTSSSSSLLSSVPALTAMLTTWSAMQQSHQLHQLIARLPDAMEENESVQVQVMLALARLGDFACFERGRRLSDRLRAEEKQTLSVPHLRIYLEAMERMVERYVFSPHATDAQRQRCLDGLNSDWMKQWLGQGSLMKEQQQQQRNQNRFSQLFPIYYRLFSVYGAMGEAKAAYTFLEKVLAMKEDGLSPLQYRRCIQVGSRLGNSELVVKSFEEMQQRFPNAFKVVMDEVPLVLKAYLSEEQKQHKTTKGEVKSEGEKIQSLLVQLTEQMEKDAAPDLQMSHIYPSVLEVLSQLPAEQQADLEFIRVKLQQELDKQRQNPARMSYLQSKLRRLNPEWQENVGSTQQRRERQTKESVGSTAEAANNVLESLLSQQQSDQVYAWLDQHQTVPRRFANALSQLAYQQGHYERLNQIVRLQPEPASYLSLVHLIQLAISQGHLNDAWNHFQQHFDLDLPPSKSRLSMNGVVASLGKTEEETPSSSAPSSSAPSMKKRVLVARVSFYAQLMEAFAQKGQSRRASHVMDVLRHHAKDKIQQGEWTAPFPPNLYNHLLHAVFRAQEGVDKMWSVYSAMIDPSNVLQTLPNTNTYNLMMLISAHNLQLDLVEKLYHQLRSTPPPAQVGAAANKTRDAQRWLDYQALLAQQAPLSSMSVDVKEDEKKNNNKKEAATIVIPAGVTTNRISENIRMRAHLLSSPSSIDNVVRLFKESIAKEVEAPTLSTYEILAGAYLNQQDCGAATDLVAAERQIARRVVQQLGQVQVSAKNVDEVVLAVENAVVSFVKEEFKNNKERAAAE